MKNSKAGKTASRRGPARFRVPSAEVPGIATEVKQLIEERTPAKHKY
jgi:hypothetical protein